MPSDTVLGLLLIGLSYRGEGDGLPHSNLDGGAYTFESGDVHKGDRIITFNPKARPAKDCVGLFGEVQMFFLAQTFASVSRMGSTEEDRKRLKNLPRYRIANGRYLRVSDGHEFGSGEEEYVRHGYKGMRKASIDFLSIHGTDGFDNSKMGRTRMTLKRLRSEYADIGLEVDFVRTRMFDGNRY